MNLEWKVDRNCKFDRKAKFQKHIGSGPERHSFFYVSAIDLYSYSNKRKHTIFKFYKSSNQSKCVLNISDALYSGALFGLVQSCLVNRRLGSQNSLSIFRSAHLSMLRISISYKNRAKPQSFQRRIYWFEPFGFQCCHMFVMKQR